MLRREERPSHSNRLRLFRLEIFGGSINGPVQIEHRQALGKGAPTIAKHIDRRHGVRQTPGRCQWLVMTQLGGGVISGTARRAGKARVSVESSFTAAAAKATLEIVAAVVTGSRKQHGVVIPGCGGGLVMCGHGGHEAQVGGENGEHVTQHGGSQVDGGGVRGGHVDIGEKVQRLTKTAYTFRVTGPLDGHQEFLDAL